jgi:spoIIIJ-associated protein
MRFEGKTLEDVYQKVSEYFNISISELDIKIVQYPKKGFFGLFAKNAIIEVDDSAISNIDKDIELIKKEVNELFSLGCFQIDEIDVKKYDEDTVYFEISGADSALLIGKEGYRYNALATLLFNWISQKYGYKTILEIASFLENQEEMMRRYLAPVIKEIEEKGRVKTNPLDGVLAFLAVKILRQEFPHKYVAIKKNRDGSQYVVVNDFKQR